MKSSKIFLAVLVFTLLSIGTVLAQTPDTTTLRLSAARRWHNVVVTLRDNSTKTGYMHYYLPYCPEKEVQLIPVGGSKKEAEKIKLTKVQRIDYADIHFEQVKSEFESAEYMARELNKGKLGLFVFTEFKQAPIPIPVAGVARIISIPFDQSIFFLRNGSKVIKIDRSLYREKIYPHVKDNEELVAKLKSKEFKFKDIPNFIAEYNAAASQQ